MFTLPPNACKLLKGWGCLVHTFNHFPFSYPVQSRIFVRKNPDLDPNDFLKMQWVLVDEAFSKSSFTLEPMSWLCNKHVTCNWWLQYFNHEQVSNCMLCSSFVVAREKANCGLIFVDKLALLLKSVGSSPKWKRVIWQDKLSVYV